MIFLLNPTSTFDLLNGFKVDPSSGLSKEGGVCDQHCETYCDGWHGCSVCYNWKSCDPAG